MDRPIGRPIGEGCMKKPNIILFMTDQQRADLRKSRGFALDTMPFLDKWAETAVDFTNGYTSCPTCMPARVSMFTGRYVESHKVRTNHNEADVYYTEDLLDVLKQAGYFTALCGKNHSHHDIADFDFCSENGHLGYGGERNSTDDEIGFADYLCSTGHMEMNSPSPYGIEVQHPYRNVSDALDVIDTCQKEDKPFFVWLSTAEPHNPYQVPAPYFDMFPPETLPPVASTEMDVSSKGDKFVWIKDVWSKVYGPEMERRILRARSNYYGMLRLIDDQFKRLIDGLDSRNLTDDTIVVYLSDHGDFVGEYGMMRKGPELPNVLCNIPFIWKGPGIQGVGQDTSHYASIVDILPTICDMLDVPSPFGCQGRSLLPILRQKDIPEKEFDCAYAECGFSGLYWDPKDRLSLVGEGAVSNTFNQLTFDCLNTWTQCGQVRSVWKNGYHLQLDMMGNGYLYDLRVDPYEMQNLYHDDRFLQVKVELLETLAAETLKATDILPAPHRRYRTKLHPKGYWYQEYHTEDPGVRTK